MHKHIRLVGLLRVSTEHQASDERGGLARQRDAISKIAAREGVPADSVIWVQLEGISGSAVADALEWTRDVVPLIADPSTHIAVDSVDRLIRASEFSSFKVLAALQFTGTDIYHPGGTYRLSTPDDVLVSGLFALLAGKEKAEILRRMKEGKEALRRAGAWVGGPIARGVAWDAEQRRWHYTGAASVVKEVFRLIVEDGLENYSEICRRTGIKTPAVLRGLVQNPIYRGLLRYNWVVEAGRHRRRDAPLDVRVIPESQQLISDQVWFAAQRGWQSRSGQYGTARALRRESHYLAGLVFCDPPPVSEPLSGLITPGAGWQHKLSAHSYDAHTGAKPRYGCCCRHSNPNSPRPPCDIGQPSTEELHDAVDRYLEGATKENWLVDAAIKTLFVNTADPLQREKEHLELQSELDRSTRMLTRAADLYIRGDITLEAYDHKKASLQRERMGIEERLAAALVATPGPAPEDFAALAAQWRYDRDWPPQRKRDWMLQYTRGLLISPRGIEAVSVRLQTPGTGEVVFCCPTPKSWEELIGYRLGCRLARFRAQGLVTTRAAAKELGLTPNGLRYWINKGVVTPPVARMGDAGWALWSTAEIAAARSRLLEAGCKACKGNP